MAWTKAKTAIVASAAVILVATTAVVRIKLERAHWTNRYLSISAGAADTAKTADEAARVFLEAMSKGDKDTIAQFLGWGAPSIDQLLTDKNKRDHCSWSGNRELGHTHQHRWHDYLVCTLRNKVQKWRCTYKQAAL